ncbi:MAG: hypothetical protein ACKVT1_05565 [Dehalococcoidia bacterium]
MAVTHPTTAAPTFEAMTTYRLRSWNEVYGVQDKRYYHAPDGEGLRTVEITRDLRIACRCSQFSQNLRDGSGPCEHVVEAIDFLSEVGYRRLPTWTLKS